MSWILLFAAAVLTWLAYDALKIAVPAAEVPYSVTAKGLGQSVDGVPLHVAHADGEAKFWLTPQVVLANHTGLSATQIRQAQAVVNAHLKEIQDAWNHHFGG